MKFRTETTYYIGKDDLLTKIFKSLPINSFVDKGRCGNGGTHLEIYNLLRCSIIVVPNVTITIDKAYPDDKPHEDRFFAVHGDITKEDVRDFLKKRDKAQKIFTTPAGLKKILWGAENLGMLDDIHNEWFFLLDEAHSAITETYREDVIEVFKHLWDFKMICLISATPYYFSDPKIYGLDYHKIKLNDSIGTVNLVQSLCVKATLKEMIEQSLSSENKLFIFFNSVTEIANLLNALELVDCRIYCANDKDGDNMKKLGAHKQFWREQPNNNDFANINFITTTAFEGWNMNIPDAVMIVATDIYKPHTLVGIDKCVQALGRARRNVKAYYHIFNHKNIRSFKSLDKIQTYYFKEGKDLLNKYIEHLKEAEENGFKPRYDDRIEKYCDDPKTNPIFNTFRLDRVVNEEYNREVYNHTDYVHKRWKEYYFNPVHMVSDLKWESRRDSNRKSKSTQLKEDYNRIMEFKNSNMIFLLSSNPIDIIKKRNPLAYRASKILNQEQMKTLKFQPRKVETEVIKRENDKKNIQLFKLIDLHFKTGSRYTKEAITKKLQQLYLTVDLRNSKDEPQVALATHIKRFFEIGDCKIKMNNGKWVNGFQLIRPTFHQKMAS